MEKLDSPRCRSCNSKFLASKNDLLCGICQGYAAGKMPVVKRSILKTSKGFTFGNITGTSELMEETFSRIVLAALAITGLAIFLTCKIAACFQLEISFHHVFNLCLHVIIFLRDGQQSCYEPVTFHVDCCRFEKAFVRIRISMEEKTKHSIFQPSE